LVKFGHTSPLLSNSGLQTLVLLAYAYYAKTSGLSVANTLDSGFQTWLEEFERGVLEFGDSTGTFMDRMVLFGPSKYDLVAVVQTLANESAEAARGRWGPLRVVYPPATIMSDHPYAALNAPWVSPAQREAADRFREFLLSVPIQELGLRLGFRPGNARVPV